MSVSSDSHSPFPVLPTRSDSARPLSTHSASGQDSSLSFRFCLLDLILTVRFWPFQILSRGCGFCLRMPESGFSFFPPVSWYLGSPAGLSIPDSCFCPSRGGSPRPAGRLCGTNRAHVYAPYPPRHPLCHRNALRAPHSTAVTFERRLITRASEISWAVAWWSQSSARPILILGRRPPIPAGAWSRGLNGMPASDAAWRRPAATPQAVVGAAQRCSQRHVCSFAVGSAV